MTDVVVGSRWWTCQQTADYLGVSRRQVYHLAERGDLKVSRINQRGDIRCCQVWADEFVERQAIPPSAGSANHGGGAPWPAGLEAGATGVQSAKDSKKGASTPH